VVSKEALSRWVSQSFNSRFLTRAFWSKEHIVEVFSKRFAAFSFDHLDNVTNELPIGPMTQVVCHQGDQLISITGVFRGSVRGLSIRSRDPVFSISSASRRLSGPEAILGQVDLLYTNWPIVRGGRFGPIRTWAELLYKRLGRRARGHLGGG
jgi:hypothetical protein